MMVLVIRLVGFLIVGLILCLGKVFYSGLKLLRSGLELEFMNFKFENEFVVEKEVYICIWVYIIDSL